MDFFLDIITVKKDDLEGLENTLKSTEDIREYPGVRQIIVDSSTGRVRNEVRELAGECKNVEYLWQAAKGIAGAFNLGLSIVKAEWVWCLNGRDEINPQIDIKAILYMLEATNADILLIQIHAIHRKYSFFYIK